MRSNKVLFVIFLAVYFIAGLSLLITGSVAHRHATHFSEITGYSLMSGAGFVIALGVLILILSIVGFIGAYLDRSGYLQIFIGSLFFILLLQLIAAIVGFTLRTRAEDQLRTKLLTSMEKYSTIPDVKTEWDSLQKAWTCCGVNKGDDWINFGRLSEIPSSCYPNNKNIPTSLQNGTDYYSTGCYRSALNLYFRYSKALGGVTLFFFFVEVIGLVLAIFLLRDVKNDYGSV